MANEKVIAGLQAIVTGLSQQADGHQIQSRIFASQGFSKLAEKYQEHAEEERAYVVKCIDRLLDLGCDVKLEAKAEAPLYKEPIEWVKHDLQVSIDGLAWLKEIVEAARDDYATFDILREYYKDEEEDMYWGQSQLELIENIGKQNWLLQQV
ncbi:bacterioferritin (cytochrome b1) [bacterium]|nr:bacterioferritin (cytochrome b1) [bacterium]